MSKKTSNTGSFRASADAFADGLARICRLYGVSPLIGRLYALLYTSTEPLSLDELCERTGAAKSTVSVALRKLLNARVAERLPPRGDRRDYYAARTDPWQMLADWHRLYFEPELRMFRESGEAIEAALEGAGAPPPAAAAVLRTRIAQMRAFSTVFDRLVGDLVGDRPAPAPARRIAIAIDDGGDAP